MPADYVAEVQREKQELLIQVNNMITTLQDAVDPDMTTGEEAVLLLEWRKRRVVLMPVKHLILSGLSHLDAIGYNTIQYVIIDPVNIIG